MKNIFCHNFFCSDPLSMAIAKERVEHVPVCFETKCPRVGSKDFMFLGEIMVRPSFDETWNRPPPALRPPLRLTVKSEKFFREVGMAVYKRFL